MSEHTQDAQRKRDKRAKERTVIVPDCEDPERRAICELDDIDWLRWYFARESETRDPFTYAFTFQQREIIEAIRRAIVGGEDAALAASRGEGKTVICQRMILKYTLSGLLKYSVLFAATGPDAARTLESMRDELERNTRLAADYPEVCIPVQAVQGAPQKAHGMLCSGKRHDNGEVYEQALAQFIWSGDQITMPKIPGSPSAEAAIETRGLDGAVRGSRYKGQRPDLAVIDDPDTEKSAASERQAGKLERRIDRAIGGLGGQNRSVGRVIITTIQSRFSVSALFTDPLKKPSFRGRRFRYLIKPPTNQALWDQYILLRKDDLRLGTKLADNHYQTNRAAMDLGAEVSNPNRLDGARSSLQNYFNLVAKLTQEAVDTEYNNDPSQSESDDNGGLTPAIVAKKLGGFARGTVPDCSDLVSVGVDVGKRFLHWVARAWARNGQAFYTIDYGAHQVQGTRKNVNEGVDDAIIDALRGLAAYFDEYAFVTTDGEVIDPAVTLVDSRWQHTAVCSFCLENPLFRPVFGHGQSEHGATKTNFRDAKRRTKDQKPGGVGWFESRKTINGHKIWIINSDSDHWKSWEHNRWLTPADKPGSMFLFGEPSGVADRLAGDELEHDEYARHVCAEHEAEMPGGKRKWRQTNKDNHWLDAGCYATIGAAMSGVNLGGGVVAAAPPRKVRRMRKKFTSIDS